MEITMQMITMVVTAIVTLIMGQLAKKFNWIASDYIPVQNVIIGALIGILVYFTGLNENLLCAIIVGLFSSLGAGGLYDLSKTKKEE